MTLNNITIQFVMTIPSIEVDKELGLEHARRVVKTLASTKALNEDEPFDSVTIIDCPDYPAVCE